MAVGLGQTVIKGNTSGGNKGGGMLRRILWVICIIVVSGAVYYYREYLIPSQSDTIISEDSKKKKGNIVSSGTANHIKNKDVKIIPDVLSVKRKKYKHISGDILTKIRQGEIELKNEEYQKAKELILSVINSISLEDNRDIWWQAIKVLNKANTKIIFSDIPAPQKILYIVKSGDSLDKIAKLCNTTVEAIQKANDLSIDNPVIHPDDQLRIYKGNWKIKIIKHLFILMLYDGKDIFKVYKIGIGKQNRTPEGTFDITERIMEPAWEHKGRVYPFGSKENILGTRWLGLTPTGTTNKHLRGYGIHGTWDNSGIGKECSNGCIRMRNSDVEELFIIIPKYKTVENKFIEVVIEK